MPTRSGWNTPSTWFSAPAGLVSGPRMLKRVRTPRLLPARPGVLHRGGVRRREHEAGADPVDRLRRLRRRHADVRAERLQHFGAARGGGHRAPDVLRDLGTGGRRDERGAGRHVEGVRGIAARAAGVDEMGPVAHLHVGGELAHDLRRGRDLADGLLLDPQADDEAGDLRRRQLAAHDLAHDVKHLVVEYLAVLDGALDRLGYRDLLHEPLPVSFPSRKFCSILCPCSVSSASGWNCTPSTARPRWRSPMISPSSDCAVTARQAGRLSRSTTSEWYRVATNSSGTPVKTPPPS